MRASKTKHIPSSKNSRRYYNPWWNWLKSLFSRILSFNWFHSPGIPKGPWETTYGYRPIPRKCVVIAYNPTNQNVLTIGFKLTIHLLHIVNCHNASFSCWVYMTRVPGNKNKKKSNVLPRRDLNSRSSDVFWK